MEKAVCPLGGRYVLSLVVPNFEEFCGNAPIAWRLPAAVDEALEDIGFADSWASVFELTIRKDGMSFVQRTSVYEDWIFTEARVLGAMFQTSMLARGIPLQGTLSFRKDLALGCEGPLVSIASVGLELDEDASQGEPVVGIYLLPSAWKPFEEQRPGTVGLYAAYGNWRIERSERLLLNPFLELQGAFESELCGELNVPYSLWCEPHFPNELLALKFVCDYVEALDRGRAGQGLVAASFRRAEQFYTEVLDLGVFEWAKAATLSPRWGR